MTAGDKGIAIVITAGGFVMTGTVTLMAAPGSTPQNMGPAEALGPCVIQTGGLTAVYTTLGTEFEQGGPWMLQIEVATSSGQVYSSQPGPIYVFPQI